MQTSIARVTGRMPHLEELLERFAIETRYVPPHARLVTDLSELPLALEGRATGCDGGAAWRAWTDDARIWFIIGRLSRLWLVQSDNRPMLYVLFFDASGELVTSGVWRRDEPGGWTLCHT